MAGSLLVLCAPAAWVFGSYFVADAGPQAVGVHSIYGIIGSSLGITYLWWHSGVRLSEHGMVVRHNFVPWSDVKRWFWDACNRDVIVFEFTWFNQVALNVPPGSREAIVRFLAATCGEEYD
jgi:hypothetical protein